MTDYSKPIGWWCPACKDNVGGRWRGAGCGGRPIPVYAVIPEGERPEGETRAEMEAHAEVVLTVSEADVHRIANPVGLGHDGSGFGSRRWSYTDPVMKGRVDLLGEHDAEDVTEADAVLYVVEGRLPE